LSLKNPKSPQTAHQVSTGKRGNSSEPQPGSFGDQHGQLPALYTAAFNPVSLYND
jgi:hypothetical protein